MKYGTRLLLTMWLALLLVVAGCSKVTMSPDYARQVTMAQITVAELNRRCQAGDELACKEGLRAASTTLSLIVDAMEGKAGEGGDSVE